MNTARQGDKLGKYLKYLVNFFDIEYTEYFIYWLACCIIARTTLFIPTYFVVGSMDIRRDNVVFENELLKYAITHGLLDANTVQAEMMNEKKHYYLTQHKYKIFKDKDGRWKTTLPDPEKQNGRRLIAKKELDDLEEVVVQFYQDAEKNIVSTNTRLSPDITLEELYPIWLQSRMLEAKNIRTVKRNDQEWKRYYKDTPITKVPMRRLTVNELKDWAHSLIEANQFNKRDYYDMALIIKKCYEYASDEGICENTWEKAKTKINTKKLKKMVKKDNETEIYFLDEKSRLIQYAFKCFEQRPWNIGVLSIPFIFLTGMRIGEVVALKYGNLGENEIFVENTEVNDYIYDENAHKFKYVGKKVEDHAKSDAGTRTIPYTSGAKKIVEMVKNSSEKYGYFDADYVFCPASKRLTSNSIDKLLYSYCEILNIPKKSAHKIRKTYISQVVNSGIKGIIDMDTACRVAGHTDLKTTFQSYYYGLDRKDTIYEKFECMFQNEV